MKNKKLLILLSLITLAGCGSTSSSTPATTSENSSSQETSSSSSLEESLSSSSSSSSEEINDERKADYAFEPQLNEVMPKISINTSDGSNDWVTQYNRQDKLDGLIDYVDCTISGTNVEEEYQFADVDAEVKVRGNYTLEYDKKPIRIKFKKKQSLFGLNDDAKCKSWVLLADYKDRSMLQNATTFYLGNTILGSDGYYSSDYRHVEVYINDQYWGVYLLVEQQQIDGDRVDIAEPEDDYEGTDTGYLIEYDGYYSAEDPEKGGDYTFTVNYDDWKALKTLDGQDKWAGVNGYTIKSDITHDSQVEFIRNYVENAYRIIYRAAYEDKTYKFNDTFTEIVEDSSITPKEAISNAIDVQSLVDTYILNEIACDPDIGWSSFYMDANFSSDGHKKLTFEAPWDFDSAYGIKKNIVNSGEGLYAANSNNPWLIILQGEDWFQDLIKEKWSELIKYDILDNSIEQVQNITKLFETKFTEEVERWPNKNYNGELTDKANAVTTQAGAAKNLEEWLKVRYNFLNSVWGDGNTLYSDEIEGYEFYRYEAEDAILTGGIEVKSGYNASGSTNGYLGNVAGGAEKTITFTVNSSIAQDAYLYLGLSKLNYDINLKNAYGITINNEPFTFVDTFLPSVSNGEEAWHTWYKVKLDKFSLISGENTIVIKTLSTEATNFDYIDIYAAEALN